MVPHMGNKKQDCKKIEELKRQYAGSEMSGEQVEQMIGSERAQLAVSIAQPRSRMMKLMLMPVRRRDAGLALAEGRFISFVKRHNTKLFATLKANR